MRTVTLGEQIDVRSTPSALNPTFRRLRQHWGFTPAVPSLPSKTKGKVESGVKYLKRNFMPGRRSVIWRTSTRNWPPGRPRSPTCANHGTTHQRPIERFAEEAPALIPTGGHASFLQAMVRDRVVAEDWLVSIDANRYSVPFGLIGQTVEVVREGGRWVIRHRGQVVAEHPVLAGRAQLSVRPEHGPGAACRATPAAASRHDRAPAHAGVGPLAMSQVRDLAVYDQLVGTTCRRPHDGHDNPQRQVASAAIRPAMTTPAQIERLGEHLRKLRLLKSGERLEALLQQAAARSCPMPSSSSRCSARRWPPRPARTSPCAPRWPVCPFVKPLETFDFGYQPSIDRKQVQTLASCHFIEHGDNVIVLGPPGVGKTHLACLTRAQGHRDRLPPTPAGVVDGP